MAQENFKFRQTDPLIVALLDESVRARVKYWQQRDDYDFEFHLGHPQGYPIYIRPLGSKDPSNLPKFDTRNKGATNYRRIDDFANNGKLYRLRQPALDDISAIVSGNWPALQQLAKKWWNRMGYHYG